VPRRSRRHPPRPSAIDLPPTLLKLAEDGGPEIQVQRVAEQVMRAEREWWLTLLENLPDRPPECRLRTAIARWVRDLRLRLGIRQSPDARRAQTRARVRRFRERQRSGGG
jgi:hypothetical protein